MVEVGLQKDTLCQKCGVSGYPELLVHCRKCRISAEHRYCLNKFPGRKRKVLWFCEQCVPKSPEGEPIFDSERNRNGIEFQDPHLGFSDGVPSSQGQCKKVRSLSKIISSRRSYVDIVDRLHDAGDVELAVHSFPSHVKNKRSKQRRREFLVNNDQIDQQFQLGFGSNTKSKELTDEQLVAHDEVMNISQVDPIGTSGPQSLVLVGVHDAQSSDVSNQASTELTAERPVGQGEVINRSQDDPVQTSGSQSLVLVGVHDAQSSAVSNQASTELAAEQPVAQGEVMNRSQDNPVQTSGSQSLVLAGVHDAQSSAMSNQASTELTAEQPVAQGEVMNRSQDDPVQTSGSQSMVLVGVHDAQPGEVSNQESAELVAEQPLAHDEVMNRSQAVLVRTSSSQSLVLVGVHDVQLNVASNEASTELADEQLVAHDEVINISQVVPVETPCSKSTVLVGEHDAQQIVASNQASTELADEQLVALDEVIDRSQLVPVETSGSQSVVLLGAHDAQLTVASNQASTSQASVELTGEHLVTDDEVKNRSEVVPIERHGSQSIMLTGPHDAQQSVVNNQASTEQIDEQLVAHEEVMKRSQVVPVETSGSQSEVLVLAHNAQPSVVSNQASLNPSEELTDEQVASHDVVMNRAHVVPVETHTSQSTVSAGAHNTQLSVASNQTSTCQTVYSCSRPIINHAWRGCFHIGHEVYGFLKAHLSSNASEKAFNASKLLTSLLRMEKLSRVDAWPNRFKTSPPSDDNIALYFFPECARSEAVLGQLLDEVIQKDLVLKVILDEVEMLVFSSTVLPKDHHRFFGKYYLWGVFRASQVPVPTLPVKCFSKSSGLQEENDRMASHHSGERKEFEGRDEDSFGITQNDRVHCSKLTVPIVSIKYPTFRESIDEKRRTEDAADSAGQLEGREIEDSDMEEGEIIDEYIDGSRPVDDETHCMELFPLSVEDMAISSKVGKVHELDLQLGLSCQSVCNDKRIKGSGIKNSILA